MFPEGLLTVMMPSATAHWAGDLSFVDTHSSRFLPSNRTTASAGAVVVLVPGATTFGTGSQTSVSCGRGFWVVGAACCAARGSVNAARIGKARNREERVRIRPRIVTRAAVRGSGARRLATANTERQRAEISGCLP